jgi:hypothetical protein
VVHDLVTQGGQVQEESYDWYAQDAHGNLWHLGEAAWEYHNGKKTSTKGSWQAGMDGAHAGILLPAHPRPGMASWHEDETVLLSLDKQTRVPSRRFDHVLVTTESTAKAGAQVLRTSGGAGAGHHGLGRSGRRS